MTLQLRDASLALSSFVLRANGEFNAARTAIFGPSGAGKTSLLELIAGLRSLDTGSIHFGNVLFENVEKGRRLPVRARRLGYVPQDDTLFPHLRVRGNLLFGHSAANATQAPSPSHVTAFLQIGELLERKVSTLSRGEKQRVAIGRALLAAPRMLLLDEPLTGLDATLKQAILLQLSALPKEFGVPMLYVTHDAGEAKALCDEVIMLEAGQITARGSPGELLG